MTDRAFDVNPELSRLCVGVSGEQVEAAAEVLWEYDSGAVEGVEELDETYSFRIGYTW